MLPVEDSMQALYPRVESPQT